MARSRIGRTVHIANYELLARCNTPMKCYDCDRTVYMSEAVIAHDGTTPEEIFRVLCKECGGARDATQPGER